LNFEVDYNEISRLIQSAEQNNSVACFVSPAGVRDRTKAAFLVGAFMILKVNNDNIRNFVSTEMFSNTI
jgi:hypothetical protein